MLPASRKYTTGFNARINKSILYYQWLRSICVLWLINITFLSVKTRSVAVPLHSLLIKSTRHNNNNCLLRRNRSIYFIKCTRKQRPFKNTLALTYSIIISLLKYICKDHNHQNRTTYDLLNLETDNFRLP